MQAELTNFLSAYLSDWKSIIDCAEWIAGVDWNDPVLDEDTRNALGLLELLVTEVTEGLRPESELWTEAATLVARNNGPLYIIQSTQTGVKIVASSSNSGGREFPMPEVGLAPV